MLTFISELPGIWLRVAANVSPALQSNAPERTKSLIRNSFSEPERNGNDRPS